MNLLIAYLPACIKGAKMATTHNGEILFTVSYNGAASSGAGRFSSETLQISEVYQIDPSLLINSQTTSTSQSQSLTTTNFVSSGAAGLKPISVTYPLSHNYYVDGYFDFYSIESKQFSFGNKSQKLYNKLSRKFVTYYSMMARDTGETSITYKYWVRQGSPGTLSDCTAPIIGPLQDLAIVSKWKVFLP